MSDDKTRSLETTAASEANPPVTDQTEVAAAEAETRAGAGAEPDPETKTQTQVESRAVAPQAEARAGRARAPKQRRGRPRLRLEELVVGTETRGKVMATAKFGVFVDIGAVTDGLVHISEFPGRRVRAVEDVVKQGDIVDVWIKDVDVEGNRISLSMRKKPTNPMSSLSPGDVLTGTVTSVTRYGAFVEIGAETEGLVHISEMSSGFVERPGEVVKVGETVEVRIKDIDLRRERISLSMIGLANDLGLAASPTQGAQDAATQEQERMPTVVELALRKALGDLQEEEPDADQVQNSAVEEPAAAGSDEPREEESLGAVYERMLAEYRRSKEAE